MSQFSVTRKIQSIERELEYRRKVYPYRVRENKMPQEVADREIALMEDILHDYKLQQVIKSDSDTLDLNALRDLSERQKAAVEIVQRGDVRHDGDVYIVWTQIATANVLNIVRRLKEGTQKGRIVCDCFDFQELGKTDKTFVCEHIYSVRLAVSYDAVRREAKK